jgi:sulfate adenylyltransferase subunit 1
MAISKSNFLKTKKNQMDLLKFITAGSVDDGKSTLIGRLLYDSKNILIDQLAQLEKQTKNKSNGDIDLSLLTDGLRAEREQGITIDVAYRYFSTPKRKFIIADAPGHVQYTRNMITGASNAELIIILVDARQGISEQTRRHSIIASLLKIPHVLVAVNKMDLVDYSEDVYNNILIDYKIFADQLGLEEIQFIPISALNGDNIVDRSVNLNWYAGETLLKILESTEIKKENNLGPSRFPVQYVIRPQTKELHDYRGYAGKITSGIYSKGDRVTILPSGLTSTIEAIEINGKETVHAFAPQSIVIRLTDDIDISRGDMIVKTGDLPKLENEIVALICWMDNKPLQVDKTYLLQHNSEVVKVIVRAIDYRLDVQTLEKQYHPDKAFLNEVVRVSLKTSRPLAFDPYNKLRTNGAAILIDETSCVTVGACLLQQKNDT